ncbi:hypothetical protein JXJ21_09365, partial [candidate division KSB1 bacterium]|nr:hypothetical protein [candidate division KSB1 bacterium]
MNISLGAMEFFSIACPGAVFAGSTIMLLWLYDASRVSSLYESLKGSPTVFFALALIYIFICGILLRLFPTRAIACSGCFSACSRARKLPGRCIRSLLKSTAEQATGHAVAADPASRENYVQFAKNIKLFVSHYSPEVFNQIRFTEALTRFTSGCFWSGNIVLAL